MSIAQDLKTVEIGGKAYAVVGRPEEMPMSIFLPARKLSKLAEKVKGNPEKMKAFYVDNMDALLDLTEKGIAFALGEDVSEELQEEISQMDILGYIELGCTVMGKFANLTL